MRSPNPPSDLIRGTGTISGSIAECSSWYLLADSGIAYEQTALDNEYQDPGLRVEFTLRQRRDILELLHEGHAGRRRVADPS